MNHSTFASSIWAIEVGSAAVAMALGLLWRVGTVRAGEAEQDRFRGDGQDSGVTTTAGPAAGNGPMINDGNDSLDRMSLTRTRRQDDPRDELARLGLLLPAIGEPRRSDSR